MGSPKIQPPGRPPRRTGKWWPQVQPAPHVQPPRHPGLEPGSRLLVRRRPAGPRLEAGV